jgi:hypothetical protein
VVNAIPEWLRPYVQTIVGTQIRVREISWRAETRIIETEPRPVIENLADLPGALGDPAIVVGPIVLAGWELPEHFRPGWWMRYDLARVKRAT